MKNLKKISGKNNYFPQTGKVRNGCKHKMAGMVKIRYVGNNRQLAEVSKLTGMAETTDMAQIIKFVF